MNNSVNDNKDENKIKMLGYRAPQYQGARPITELGEVFNGLIREFSIKARATNPSWAEKWAGVLLMYEGKPYSIGPAELRCDDSQFAMVSNELMDKLYECGAYEMFYTGMLD